jgi:tRNA (guanine-N7-)-methyltransferase
MRQPRRPSSRTKHPARLDKRATGKTPRTETRGDIEHEFGVPIPGVILPPEQWAKTALKKLPPGLWNWEEIFGRQAPLIIDIGCGNGRFVLGSALERSEHDHLGLDILPVVIRYATRRANQRGLSNVRFAVIGGRELLAEHIPTGSVTELHIYHPQPFYDPAKVDRRLITPEFLSLVHRSLVPDGKLFLQTDNPSYWAYIRQVVPYFFDFHELNAPWPDTPRGRTRRELMARHFGLPIFRGWALRRDDISIEEALQLANELPPPTFNAERRLKQLDEMEK